VVDLRRAHPLAPVAGLAAALVLLAELVSPLLLDQPVLAQDPEVRYDWQLDIQTSGVTDGLFDVEFISDQVGVAVGDANTIIRTTNGGASWQRVMERRDGGTRFVDVRFTSPTDGWVRGGTTLLHTDSAGERWRTVSLPQICQSGFQALASAGQTAFISCVVSVFRSDDAGRNWTELSGRLPHNDYNSMSFADSSRGWLVRNQGEGPQFGGLTTTSDGGRTWQQSSLFGSGQIWFQKVQFVSPAIGWVMPPLDDFVLSTRDGGQTWDSFPTGIRSQVDAHFLNDTMGFLVAHGQNQVGQVLQTLDAGQTWLGIGTLSNPDLMHGLHAPTPERVWTVGAGGYVAHLRYVAVPL
jgi:photosystem II stability/assembly factor-like uncharacterized protein